MVPTILTLWPWSWWFLKTSTLLMTYWMLSFDISHEGFYWQKLSMETNIFHPVTLTSEFGLFENVNLVNNIWKASARALLFHMIRSICWYLNVDNEIDIGHNFEIIINIRASILHVVISCDRIFLLISICPSYLGHYWGHLCFTTTSCFCS